MQVGAGDTMSLHLSNADWRTMRQSVERTSTEVQTNYHNLFQSTMTLVNTQNYTGASANALKRYFDRVTIPIMAEIMELSEELAVMLRKAETDFQGLESSASGIIRQSRLEQVRDRLLDHQNVFQDDIERVSRLNERIRNLGVGVTTGALGRNAVVGSYRDARKELLNINVELNNIDRQNLAEISRIKTRITRLRTIIRNVGRAVFSGSAPNFSNTDGIPRNIAVGGMGVLLRKVMADLDNASLFSHSWAKVRGDGTLETGTVRLLFEEGDGFGFSNGVFSASGKVGLADAHSTVDLNDNWQWNSFAGMFTLGGDITAGLSGIDGSGDFAVVSAGTGLYRTGEHFSGSIGIQGDILSASPSINTNAAGGIAQMAGGSSASLAGVSAPMSWSSSSGNQSLSLTPSLGLGAIVPVSQVEMVPVKINPQTITVVVNTEIAGSYKLGAIEGSSSNQITIPNIPGITIKAGQAVVSAIR